VTPYADKLLARTAARADAERVCVEALRLLAEWLTRNTGSPDAVRRRAFMVQYVLGQGDGSEVSQRELAERLGLQQSTVSEGICAAVAGLKEIREAALRSTGSETEKR
jgi:hypothetical protein